MAELDDGSGSELQVWDLGTWLPIATAIPHTGSTDAPEPLTWTTSNPMRLTVGSDRLFVGDEQWFGAMTTSLKPVGPALGKHRSDDVAVSISYHRSPILHFGFSGPDHSGWTSTPDNWSTMDKASCLLSTTGHERFYDSPESVFSTSDEDILTMGYTALCGPLNLTLRWRIQYAPGIWGDFSTQTSIPIPVSADSKLHISSVPLNVSSWQSKNIRQLQLVTEGNGQDCGPGQILIHWMAVTGKKVE